jgi:hypothetical protein
MTTARAQRWHLPTGPQRTRLAIFFAALLIGGSCTTNNRQSVAPAPATPTTNRAVKFEPSSENFANPERGFAYQNDVPWPSSTPWGYCRQGDNFSAYNYTAWNTPLDPTMLATERAQGRSVVMSRYHIAAFRDTDLSAEYLAFLDRDFATARQAGVKQIIRFAYNYPNGGPDAPVSQVLRHLDQLKPVLQRSKDVIATMEAGFIGCWGEWHSSSNELLPKNYPPISPQDGYINDSTRAIITKLLETLPADRFLQMRYPRNVFEYFGSTDLSPIAPLSATNAYDGSARARIGHQEDCFVCNDTHGGSYWNPRGTFQEAPNFLRQNNLFAPQGGEPGDPESTDPTEPGNPNSPLSACNKIRDEFHDFSWSTVGLFNTGAPYSAIKRWQRDGCWDEFTRNLGYRFRMNEATVPTTARAGDPFSLSVSLTNEGYARPFNPRGMEVALQNTKSGAITRVAFVPPIDARLWLPGRDETKVLPIDVTLPPSLAPGTYDVMLNLPDPEPTLNTRPEFSIRLANTNTWQPATGYNSLLTSVTVS